MNSRTRLLSFFLIGSSLFALVGCPAILDDYFEGTIKVFNADPADTVTGISVTEDCSDGWTTPITVSLAPGQAVNIDRDVGTYDVRVCYGDGSSCYIEANVDVEVDETTTVISQNEGYEPAWCF